MSNEIKGIFLSIFGILCIVLGFWVGMKSGDTRVAVAQKKAFKSGKKAGRSQGYFKGHEVGLKNAGDISSVAVKGFQDLVLITQKKFESDAYQNNLAKDITSLRYMDEDLKKFGKFKLMLKDLHHKVLYGIHEMYDLPRSVGEKVIATYDEAFPEIAERHYRAFQQLNKSTLVHSSNHFISYNNYQMVKNFNKIVKDEICDVVDTVLPVIKFKYASKLISYAQAKAEARKYNPQGVEEDADSTGFAMATEAVLGTVIGELCDQVFGDVLKNVQTALLEKAMLQDVASLKVKEKSRHTIAELATIEDEYSAMEYRTFKREVAWGVLPNSESEVAIQFNSVVKAGVDLDEFFEIKINSTEKIISITLPEPKVLSNEPHYKVLRLHDGWIWNEVTESQLNIMLDAGKTKIENLAIEANILEEAKENATNIIYTLLQPLTNLPDNVYQVNVRFQNDPVQIEDI